MLWDTRDKLVLMKYFTNYSYITSQIIEDFTALHSFWFFRLPPAPANSVSLYIDQAAWYTTSFGRKKKWFRNTT